MVSDSERTPGDKASAMDGASLPGEPAEQPAKPSHLTGLKLFLSMTGSGLVMFLAMLDIAIIGTVRQGLPTRERRDGRPLTYLSFTGNPEDHERIPQARGCRLVYRRLPAREVRRHFSFATTSKPVALLTRTF